jgi:alkanesulfonate monooxygenase SsuD/methylene tetrahydromethanopterin reductase-like flavin-dependent oxidoreductase (luciferase family)
MEYGLFTMPSHPPERSLFDGHQWDLQQLHWADELGFSEAWVGEHHTSPWELPRARSPVARASGRQVGYASAPAGSSLRSSPQTRQPVAMLDHLARGRLNFAS